MLAAGSATPSPICSATCAAASFPSLPRRPVVDAYRRNLQQAFVDQMDRLITRRSRPAATGFPFPGFVPRRRGLPMRGRWHSRAAGASATLRAAVAKPTDRATRRISSICKARIDRS